MTPFQKHRTKWESCKRCTLCKTRNKVVIARGKLPAPILFIGEAPGASEDVIGKPFVGPAGKLLDKIIEKAIDGQFDYCMTNLVGCIPLAEGNKTLEPPEESIEACTDRVKAMIRLCKPRLIVAVGKLAAKYIEPSYAQQRFPGEKSIKKGIRVISIVHPAAILRADITQQGLAIQRCIVTIEEAIEEL